MLMLQDFIQTATSCHVARRSTAAELLQHPWIVRYCSTQLVDTLAASPGRLSAPVSRRTEESAVPAPTLAAKSRMSVDAQSQKHWTARPAPGALPCCAFQSGNACSQPLLSSAWTASALIPALFIAAEILMRVERLPGPRTALYYKL